MNIVCAGFGGQGVLTAGLILGNTATELGKNVTWIPSYGSEMRGGTANCNLKISDKKISSPFVKYIDILIVMNQPSVDKFEQNVKPSGLIVSNSSMIKAHKFREDVKLVEVDATNIADEIGNPKGGNLAMLGGLAKAETLMDKETIIKGMNDFFESKGKKNPKNVMCIEKAYEKAVVRQ